MWKCIKKCMWNNWGWIVGAAIFGAAMGALVGFLDAGPVGAIAGALVGAGIFGAVAVAGTFVQCRSRCRG